MFTVRGQTKCFYGVTAESSHSLALLCGKFSIKYKVNVSEMRTTMNTVDNVHTVLPAAHKSRHNIVLIFASVAVN